VLPDLQSSYIRHADELKSRYKRCVHHLSPPLTFTNPYIAFSYLLSCQWMTCQWMNHLNVNHCHSYAYSTSRLRIVRRHKLLYPRQQHESIYPTNQIINHLFIASSNTPTLPRDADCWLTTLNSVG
jgi:hypothetical protein